MTQTAEELDLVLLELHPRAAAVAEPSAGERGPDIGGGHLDPGREALDHRDERGAVGLTGGQPTQHAPNHPTRRGVRWRARHRGLLVGRQDGVTRAMKSWNSCM